MRTNTGATYSTARGWWATGVEPEVTIARNAGLPISQGRVPVDAQMRTVTSGVFAAGDVAIAHHPRSARPLSVEHWGDAIRMGAIAGRNAAGRSATWTEPPGFWSTIGDHTLKHAAWVLGTTTCGSSDAPGVVSRSGTADTGGRSAS